VIIQYLGNDPRDSEKKSGGCTLYYRVYDDIKNFIPIKKQPKKNKREQYSDIEYPNR